MQKFGVFIFLLFLSCLGFASPPPANDVFQLTVKPSNPNGFTMEWQIKKGFFLYQKRIKLQASPDSNVHLGPLVFPPTLTKKTAEGKKYAVYRHHLTLSPAILGERAGETRLTLVYQGCSDDGFCYPPQTKRLQLTIDSQLALTNATLETSDEEPLPAAHTPRERETFAQLFSTHNWLLIVFSFFGFGLLLSFTPCVLPMVPVLSGIIVGHGNALSTRKAFFLSLSYVLSMSITYAFVGALVALMGNNLQIAMQTPWVIGLFSLIFVLLALSMFGFYQLRLPLNVQVKLASITHSHSGGHYLGSALMGSLSTLILSPCVTAPLIGALSYIAQSGDMVLGSLSLFFLSLGMGTPLLLIGTSAGKLLPKAGHWMNAVKAFFGVMLLAVAIYLMERLLPAWIIMILWASLLIFSGIYMGALTKACTNQEKLSQGLGIILLMYGLLILIGASQGHSDPLQPLVAKNTTPSPQAIEHRAITVTSLTEVQQAINNAKGKPILLDFYADWCEACKVVANTTLLDPTVRKALDAFVVLNVDLSANNADTNALLTHYHVVAPPTFLFYNAKGHEIDTLRLVGEPSIAMFYNNLTATQQSALQ